MRFLGDFIDPELAAGLGADAIIGPISPFLHLPPSLDVNLRSTSSGGDEADVGGDEPPLLAVVPETEPPGKLVRWFWRYFEFILSLFSDIEYSLVRSDSVVDTDLEGSLESVNKIDLETADPLETFDVGNPNHGASHSTRMSNSRVNPCKLISN